MKLVFALFAFSFAFVQGEDAKRPLKDKYPLHKICEAALHKQIDEEMNASLVYATMAAHFDHNSVARKGFNKFFSENSVEEREHAHKFINYLNRRGGRFSGFNVKMPTKYIWSDGLEALQEAVDLEKRVNNKLYSLHDIAALQCSDQHLMDFLENEFFDEQVESIDALLRHVAVLSAMNDGTGEFLFDGQLAKGKSEI